MAFNRKQKLRDNIEAVRTAFTLDRERRTPTERERALLERYCGFGGLKCILNPARELADAARWAKSDLELFAPTVELHRLIHENSRDEAEYKRYVDSLKASVLTAFYTPQAITDTIADALHDRKVRPKLVLEPSAGMGAFIAPILSNNPQADVMAFEKDLLTGKMLGHLYPRQKIRTEGFEKIEKPFLNRFDLAISNIPFGDIAVFDPAFTDGKDKIREIASKTIHNYFFLKALDAVKDGGVVAFITSQGVMDSRNMLVRGEMMMNADLLSAVRLPSNLFTDNANTEVGSDLIILQKHEGKTGGTMDEAHFIAGLSDGKSGLEINNYYKNHPERIIHTDAKRDTDPYGKPAMVYTHSGGVEGIATDLYRMLSEDLSARLDLERYNSVKGERLEARQTIVVQPAQAEMGIEENPAQPKEEPVQTVAQEAVTKRLEAPVMDLYDLFGFTQEERRLAERGLKPKRKDTGKSKRKKQQELPLFPPSELKQMEVKPKKKEKPKPEPPAVNPVIDEDPEDAVYRSLDWETNPPINGFYEMMMSLTPEKRAELRRLGKEKMDANAAKQAAGLSETEKEVRPVYPIENAYEVGRKNRLNVWKGRCARRKPP